MYGVSERPDVPCVKQLSVFLPNRVGALMMVMRVLEAEAIRLCAVSVMDAADHAVVRLVVDRPTLAMHALTGEGYPVFEADLLGVRLPDTKLGTLRRMLSALLVAELNVDYVYPIVAAGEDRRPLLGVHVEDLLAAIRTLSEHGFELIGQDDLR